MEVPSQQVLQADASQALVTLTIPSEYLPVQPDAGFDPTAYAVENGFADAVLEADGALTITMTQRYYDTFRAALYDAIAAQMTQATQTDYLSGLEYSEDFSSISVQANAAGYRAATDFFRLCWCIWPSPIRRIHQRDFRGALSQFMTPKPDSHWTRRTVKFQPVKTPFLSKPPPLQSSRDGGLLFHQGAFASGWLGSILNRWIVPLSLR